MNKKKHKSEKKWVPPKWVSVLFHSGIAVFTIGIVLHLINFLTFEWMLGIVLIGGLLFAIGAEGRVSPDVPGVWENDY